MIQLDLLSLRFGRDLRKTPPLGPLSLMASARRAGFECRLIDGQFASELGPFRAESLAELLTSLDAPVLGISLFNDAIPVLIAALDLARESLAGRRILVGGPGVVGIAAPLLERLPQIEAVVVGEGETALSQLLANPGGAVGRAGVFQRDEQGRIFGHGRSPHENLDALAEPDWTWCRGKSYARIPFSTMRGCPYDCSFCEVTAFMGRDVSKRRLASAIDGLEHAIEALGTHQIDIVDDTFTLSRKRVLEFCRIVTERKLGIEFSIYSRIDTLDDEQLEALAAAGCRRIFFGIDSGDEAVLSRIAKGISLSRVKPTIGRAAEFCAVTASFIWGYPFESREAFDHTLALASELAELPTPYTITPQLHLLSPSAGTPLFDEFGDRLMLDESVENRAVGSLAVRWSRPDSQLVLDVIRQNRLLAAPFYRYSTDDFEYKRRRVEALHRDTDRKVGALLAEICAGA